MSEKKTSRRRKNGTEIRLLETKYGIKVLVRQGDNKVWLNQRHVMTILTAIVGKAFEHKEETSNASSI